MAFSPKVRDVRPSCFLVIIIQSEAAKIESKAAKIDSEPTSAIRTLF